MRARLIEAPTQTSRPMPAGVTFVMRARERHVPCDLRGIEFGPSPGGRTGRPRTAAVASMPESAVLLVSRIAPGSER